MRRYFFKALDSDRERMGKALHLILPKSPAARGALRAEPMECAHALPGRRRLEIDNGATGRANRDIAIGRGNWTFFGSDEGGKTAAVPMNFIATCKRCRVEPCAWFCDVLSRVATHPVNRLAELLPHNWTPLNAAIQA